MCLFFQVGEVLLEDVSEGPKVLYELRRAITSLFDDVVRKRGEELIEGERDGILDQVVLVRKNVEADFNELIIAPF